MYWYINILDSTNFKYTSTVLSDILSLTHITTANMFLASISLRQTARKWAKLSQKLLAWWGQ